MITCVLETGVTSEALRFDLRGQRSAVYVVRGAPRSPDPLCLMRWSQTLHRLAFLRAGREPEAIPTSDETHNPVPASGLKGKSSSHSPQTLPAPTGVASPLSEHTFSSTTFPQPLSEVGANDSW